MYRKVIRPILFLFEPERAHNIFVWMLRIAGCIPLCRKLLHKCYAVEHPSLERDVFGISFKNPIGVAAGFDRNADIYRELSALGFGFVEVGTITPRPQTGNPRPRLFRLVRDKALLNRTGIANRGLERAITRLRRPHAGMVVGCNIGKNNITPVESQPADYLKVFRNLYQYADYFTVNVSHNTAAQRESLPLSKENVLRILTPLFEFRRGQNQYCPILLKISADLSDELIDDMTDIMLETPLDGIVAVNATSSREGLTTTGLPAGSGTVSGPTLTRRSVEVVKRIYDRSHGTYPIIGVGGLMTPDDIKAMLDAGATLVQLYTGIVYEGMKLVRDTCRMLIAEAQKAENPSPSAHDEEAPVKATAEAEEPATEDAHAAEESKTEEPTAGDAHATEEPETEAPTAEEPAMEDAHAEERTENDTAQ